MDQYSYPSVNLKLKNLLFILIALLAAGCGHHSNAEGKVVFKGQVVKVEYRLIEGTTVLIDAEGKKTTLEGHPGVPCTDVEIVETKPHEYEIFFAPKSS